MAGADDDLERELAALRVELLETVLREAGEAAARDPDAPLGAAFLNAVDQRVEATLTRVLADHELIDPRAVRDLDAGQAVRAQATPARAKLADLWRRPWAPWVAIALAAALAGTGGYLLGAARTSADPSPEAGAREEGGQAPGPADQAADPEPEVDAAEPDSAVPTGAPSGDSAEGAG